MPKYQPSEDELSGYGTSPPAETPEKAAPAESVDEENAGATEILIAKNKLPGGTKEGDECTFRVTKDFGDEVSLAYVKESEEQTSDEPMSKVGSELTALSEEGE